MTGKSLLPRILPLLLMAGCAEPAHTSAVAVPPIPAGAARVWVYRDFEPYESLNRPEVMLNGADAGLAELGGAFYRNVPPGHYRVTVASVGEDFNQTKDVNLAPGQEAYVKILSLRAWLDSGDKNDYKRDTFYVSLMPPQTAKVELGQTRYYGGS